MKKRLFWIGFGGVLAVAAVLAVRPRPAADRFARLTNRGNGFLEQGDAASAISAYTRALRLSPESADVRLNLANAYLLANRCAEAIAMCRQTLALERSSAAAYYLMGCAYLRLNQPDAAVRALQQSWDIDPNVAAVNFQLGLAQERLGQTAAAIRDFEATIFYDPGHPSAHYLLSRLYQQVGRDADAARELRDHQGILAKAPGAPSGAAAFERCVYTLPRAAFIVGQPDARGVRVRFVNGTAAAFGPSARDYRGPIAAIDYDHDGRNSLFARERGRGFRLLDNRGGRFKPIGRPIATPPDAGYRACLVGDIDNDGFEDVVVLGVNDSREIKLYAGGRMLDVTGMTRLRNLKAGAGLLADLDFTGNLDLLTIPSDGSGLRVYRNLGHFSFEENTAGSGLPARLPQAAQVEAEDWDNEGLPGIFVARSSGPPVYYAKKRAAGFVPTRVTDGWPAGPVMAIGDLNNDLLPDAVIATGGELEVIRSGNEPRLSLPLRGLRIRGLLLADYDNDGWLDVIAYGDNGIRVWRNRGHRGFEDVTTELGLDQVASAEGVVAADFDGDGAPDLVISSASGLQFWRNDGGSANSQLKLRLVGRRSNASALGVRVDVASGNWRTSRTVRWLPLEIGVGRHREADAIKVHWFDLTTTLVGVPVTRAPLVVKEPTLPSGSCPYLYAWDGERFRFVTDILGAAPLGLPQSEGRYIDADPTEFLPLGDDRRFPPRNGAYQLRVTDELREVLYLDQVRLVAVDHPAGTLVGTTGKLRAGEPFPPPELWTLRPVARLRQATRSDGLDVTAALSRIDGRMVSPVSLRRPQLRGLAEPFSVTMDFGPPPVDRPLVLALTGWLRFGGGMANVAASIDPTLPNPFPTLDAQLPDGSWKRIDVNVGAPAGKTKTILVDLDHKLPAGSRRLRLTTAFEIYWDCALLCERVGPAGSRQAVLAPGRADLHWRGFSRYASLPAWMPLTPEYGEVFSNPPWDRTPAGWCTRYGDVRELLRNRDDQLVLMNGGDELALSFDARRLPPEMPGMVRDFYLYVVGWDKDADFHVARGWEVEPLPFGGMDDQAYGRQPRPASLDSAWIRRYDTRWVGPTVVDRSTGSQPAPEMEASERRSGTAGPGAPGTGAGP